MGMRGNENCKHYKSHFPCTQSKPIRLTSYVYYWKEKRHSRKLTHFGHLYYYFDFRLFLKSKEFHSLWVYWLLISRCQWKTATGAMRWEYDLAEPGSGNLNGLWEWIIGNGRDWEWKRHFRSSLPHYGHIGQTTGLSFALLLAGGR